jgi:hypothetical protein
MAAGIGLGARFGGAEEHCPVGCAREPVFDHVVVLLAVVPRFAAAASGNFRITTLSIAGPSSTSYLP